MYSYQKLHTSYRSPHTHSLYPVLYVSHTLHTSATLNRHTHIHTHTGKLTLIHTPAHSHMQHTQTHAHRFTYTHTQAHSHSHSHMHRHTHTRTGTLIHTQVHLHTHTGTLTHTRTGTHTHTQAHSHSYTQHTQTHTHTGKFTHTHRHTHTHTHKLTLTHTHRHNHIQTCPYAQYTRINLLSHSVHRFSHTGSIGSSHSHNMLTHICPSLHKHDSQTPAQHGCSFDLMTPAPMTTGHLHNRAHTHARTHARTHTVTLTCTAISPACSFLSWSRGFENTPKPMSWSLVTNSHLQGKKWCVSIVSVTVLTPFAHRGSYVRTYV